MAGAGRGFVFSLDSFVAFSLVLIAVQSLVAISATPSGYYNSLAQANFIAKDSLTILSHVRYNDGQDLFGEAAAAASSGDISGASRLILLTNSLVPPPYSYSYDYYDFGDQKWHMIYNASVEGCPGGAGIGNSVRFCNVTFNRVQASSSLFVGVYKLPLEHGASPYCNVACTGYDAATNAPKPASDCTKVPCNVQKASTFYSGDFSLGLIRLRVWG